jgi:hypothetical protein
LRRRKPTTGSPTRTGLSIAQNVGRFGFSGASWRSRCRRVHRRNRPAVGYPPYVYQHVLAFLPNSFGFLMHRGGRDARVPVLRRCAAIVGCVDNWGVLVLPVCFGDPVVGLRRRNRPAVGYPPYVCPPYVCRHVLAFRSNFFGSITHRGGRDARVPVLRRFAAIVCLSADIGRFGFGGACWRSSCRLAPTQPPGGRLPTLRLPTLRLPTCLGVQFKLFWFYYTQRRAGHPRSSPRRFAAVVCLSADGGCFGFAGAFWRSSCRLAPT